MPQAEILKTHYRSPEPSLNTPRRDEDVGSDTLFSEVPALDGGETMAQVYTGRKSRTYHAYGMHSEKQFINTLEDCVNEYGAPNRLLTDNAAVEDSERVKIYLRALQIGRWKSESYKQHQNPVERDIQTLKTRVNVIMDRFGCPDKLWLHCLKYVCYLLNHTYHPTLKGIPMQKLLGSTRDISILCASTSTKKSITNYMSLNVLPRTLPRKDVAG